MSLSRGRVNVQPAERVNFNRDEKTEGCRSAASRPRVQGQRQVVAVPCPSLVTRRSTASPKVFMALATVTVALGERADWHQAAYRHPKNPPGPKRFA